VISTVSGKDLPLGSTPGDFNSVWKGFAVGVNADAENSGSFFISDMGTDVMGPGAHRIDIDSDGNVGIGTTSPSAKLDVSVDVNVGSDYKIDGTTVLAAPGTSILVGEGAGENNTGNTSVLVGKWAGRFNQAGGLVALGVEAGASNEGIENVFVGSTTGSSNTEGSYNTFLGDTAGFENTTGSYNTFVGDAVGYYNTTGGRNTFLGMYAGYDNETGNGNVFIGNSAGSHETGSNKLYIANDEADANVLIYGDFSAGQVGIGLTDPCRALDVDGTARLRSMPTGTGTTVLALGDGTLAKLVSSRRYKRNIEELEINADAVL
jgi:hypothetical protein